MNRGWGRKGWVLGTRADGSESHAGLGLRASHSECMWEGGTWPWRLHTACLVHRCCSCPAKVQVHTLFACGVILPGCISRKFLSCAWCLLSVGSGL